MQATNIVVVYSSCWYKYSKSYLYVIEKCSRLCCAGQKHNECGCASCLYTWKHNECTYASCYTHGNIMDVSMHPTCTHGNVMDVLKHPISVHGNIMDVPIRNLFRDSKMWDPFIIMLVKLSANQQHGSIHIWTTMQMLWHQVH